jgi:hypothetical protein
LLRCFWIASLNLSSDAHSRDPLARNDETVEMLAKTQHLFDDATRVTAGDSRWRGQSSDDYWAFVGPFGGATAATILRALIDHPQRAGDPLALTVNFCAPIAQGVFDIDVRLVKANRSTQHWSVELSQDGADVATLRPRCLRSAAPRGRTSRRNFRKPSRSSRPCPIQRPRRHGSSSMICALSRAIWISAARLKRRRRTLSPNFGSVTGFPRKIDMLSLTAMSDAFFGRVFHARRELLPFGTVSLTTYFHTDSEDLAAEDISRVLAVADARIFHKSYGDQTGELWSPKGRLLATTHQIGYFKA